MILVPSFDIPSGFRLGKITEECPFQGPVFFGQAELFQFQKMVIITFVHLEKINIFCFMHKSVAQKLSPPRPLEN